MSGRVLEYDFPAFEVGVAEYEEGPTGCTVFHFPDGAACATDARGGSPGVLGGYEWVRAICLAGGSLYGLEAATGVASELFERGGFSTEWTAIAPVSGAILFDFGFRDTASYPDKELGRAALQAAQPNRFPLGPRGAGRSATVGKGIDLAMGEPGGQGGAFREVDGVKTAVFTVVNAVGAIVDREERVVRGNLDRSSGERLHYLDALERRLAQGEAPSPEPGATTLSVVVTDLRLPMRELRQFGRQVHDSMTRAIRPFHAFHDGDVLYALTTGEVEHASLDATSLGVLASELAWDAVLACFDA